MNFSWFFLDEEVIVSYVPMHACFEVQKLDAILSYQSLLIGTITQNNMHSKLTSLVDTW